ncbi:MULTISPECIES: hypothetical protein [unclassified Mesobacillus]|uniref:hypothetical protein n=1 Tax=unclassified Mesobacillus TaxID=2675270 RepID=UPI00203D11CD|nr:MULTISPECIES: hypothetical protein [unclassified Mesobacillus]MCM3124318.1 hypothetical protein [Mesobacillus sp. MER 33]MCM3234972.1 hypothetical protein [Mesobacillus sp. MER 48]
MNKKVKWSVISASTITALTFGGLVMNNEKAAGNENSVPENDWLRENFSAFTEEGYEENEYSDDEGDRYYGDHDDDDEYEEHDDEGYEDDDEGYEDDDEGYEDDDDDHYRSEQQEQGTSWGQDQIVNAPERGFRQEQSSSRTSR